MADCAVAPHGLCLRIAPPESLDVTQRAHAFVTLARPRRGCRSRAAWLCAVLGLRRRPAGQDPIRASTRGQGSWPPWACWPGLCQRTTRSTPGKLIIVVTVNVRRRGRLRADAWPRSAPPVRRLLQRHRPEVVGQPDPGMGRRRQGRVRLLQQRRQRQRGAQRADPWHVLLYPVHSGCVGMMTALKPRGAFLCGRFAAASLPTETGMSPDLPR